MMTGSSESIPPVSVVVPCLNEAAYIGALLDGIRGQRSPVFEVVIVDTGSTDDTMAIVRGFQQRHHALAIRCLECAGAGVAEAVNCGVDGAGGEIIVRLDGHSLPAPDYVGRAITALKDPGIGVIGGVWDIRPGGTTKVAEAIARTVAHPIGAGDAAYRITKGGGRRQVDTVPFGCFRKTTWTELGGLNEQLLANEDYEFNYRVRLSGASVVLDPPMQCVYFARRTLLALSRQYWRYGWWKAQVLKRYPRSLRWRQAMPASLVPGFVGLMVAGMVGPGGRLAMAVACLVYAGAVVVGAVRLVSPQTRWDLFAELTVAIILVHASWSLGFVSNLVSGGRWPRWCRQRIS